MVVLVTGAMAHPDLDPARPRGPLAVGRLAGPGSRPTFDITRGIARDGEWLRGGRAAPADAKGAR
jgi:hypothetical protein